MRLRNSRGELLLMCCQSTFGSPLGPPGRQVGLRRTPELSSHELLLVTRWGRVWFRTTPRICSMNWSIRSGVPTLPRLGGFYPADQPTVASIRTLRGAARCPRLICAYALPQPSRPSSTASAPRPIPIYPSRSDGVAIRHRWLPGANRGGAKRKRQEKRGVVRNHTPLLYGAAVCGALPTRSAGTRPTASPGTLAAQLTAAHGYAHSPFRPRRSSALLPSYS